MKRPYPVNSMFPRTPHKTIIGGPARKHQDLRPKPSVTSEPGSMFMTIEDQHSRERIIRTNYTPPRQWAAFILLLVVAAVIVGIIFLSLTFGAKE